MAAVDHAVPRHALAWAALVYLAATMLLAWPALGGSFLVSPHSDQYIAGYAFREFAAASLRAGDGFPQWNPYLFGGMPFIAAMHGDIFYPTFLLRMIMPTDVAMTWGFIIHLFLAGLFTYGFLRAYGIGFHGALIGGLAYMLSGPIAGYASPGHDGKLFVSALLPLALWMITRGVRDDRPWSWGVLALTIGLAVLSPHPQLLQYLLLVSGAFALFLAFSGDASGAKFPTRVIVSRLGRAFGAVVVGFLIGAIQYASVMQYVDWSPRSGGKGYEHAVSYSLPVEELVNVVVPQFSGILDNYWGRNTIHFHSEYAGVAVLILAGAGMFAAVTRRGFRWFWLGTLGVSLLWALGGSTPFYQIVYALVPGTKFFRAPSTMMYVTMFSVAVFAALGTERVLSGTPALGRRFFAGWAIAVAAIGLMIAGGLATSVAQSIGSQLAALYPDAQPSAVIAFKVEQAERNQAFALLGALRSILAMAVTLATVWVAGRGRIAPRLAAPLLAAVVALDLWSVERHYWIFSPRAAQLYATDAAIERIKADSVPGRVLTFAPRGSPEGADPVFAGDAMMIHRVRSVAGYHGNELGRYQELLRASSGGLDPAFWRHANVRWLYTSLPDSAVPAGFARVAGPVRTAYGSMVNLYRVPGDNPPAWVATAIVKAPDQQALATVLNGRFEPERAAIFDSASSIAAPELTAPPAPATVRARVTRYDADAIDVSLDAAAPRGSALLVAENYYPGWQASADGKDAAVARANYNLVGVVLPEGARTIQLRFRDPAYPTGRLITLVALGVALAAIVAGVALQRRRPAFAS